jgi:hypothetical protein
MRGVVALAVLGIVGFLMWLAVRGGLQALQLI